MKSPLLILAACFAAGILIGRLLAPSFALLPLIIAAASGCLLVGLILLRKDRVRFSGFLALAGFVLAGVAARTSFQHRFLPCDIHNLAAWGLDLQKDVEVEGVVAGNPIRGHSSLGFDFECRRIEAGGKWRRAQGKVQMRMFTPANAKSWAAADSLDLRYGDLIRAPVRFERPRVYRNPGSFDFRWWLEAINDISWEGSIRNPAMVQKLSASQVSRFSMLVADARARLSHGIDRLYPSWSPEGRVGAVLKAVLLGDRSSLDSDTIENFRQSGLYHLLVISGLHVGLLASVILFFLYLFRVGETWRALWLLVLLGGYSLLVEQRAPTLRATLMIAAYLLARFLYRDRSALNAVGLAALILLFHRPAWLFEAGFELSFSAALLIAGLALPILQRTTVPYRSALARLGDVERDSSLAPRLAQLRLDLRSIVRWFERSLPGMGRRPALCEWLVTTPARILLWAVDLVLFSAILQIGLLMPMAETFHRVTIVGIGLNTIAFPLMTLLIAIAVPTVILAATLPFLAVLPGKLLFLVTNALLALTGIRSEPLWMSYRIPEPPFWVALGFTLAVVAIALTLGRHHRACWFFTGAFTLFTAIVVTYPFAPKITRRTLEVTALDCGRGEAVFSVLPDGTTMLTDAGGREQFRPDIGRWNPGEEIVSPYLWSRGIKRIDVVVLEEGSDENINAVNAVLHNFEVGELWQSPELSSPAEGALLDFARERHIRIREIAAGDGKGYGETTVQVLWPPLSPSISPLPFSERSPVLRIADNHGSILLRGNTDEEVERSLAKSGGQLSSTVLVSARPVSEIISQKHFLALVDPQIVLDSSGVRNRRDPGDRERIQVPSSADVPVFTTARDGAITIDLSDSSFSVHCFGSLREFEWRRQGGHRAGPYGL
jgi:competence protein ComEC